MQDYKIHCDASGGGVMEATAIEERPILFSAPMVRAILDGRKTQTRRVIKASATAGYSDKPSPASGRLVCKDGGAWDDNSRNTEPIAKCPYGKTGDRLWVRETGAFKCKTAPIYRADLSDEEASLWKFSPSIHMPRWASRIDLEITDIRVERVQDISAEDAIAEGIESEHQWDGKPPFAHDMGMWYRDYSKKEDVKINDPVYSFQTLWDSLNAKRGFGWSMNPWVWVVEFKKLEAG